MSVVMEMTLLLLFLGGVWAEEALEVFTTRQPSFSLAPTISGASNLTSVASDDAITRVPEAHGHTGPQISLPSSAPGEVPSPGTSVASHVSLMADAMITQESPTRKLSMAQEISDATSDPTVPAVTILGLDTTAGETMATSSLETSNGTSGLPVTVATSSPETPQTSGSPISTVKMFMSTPAMPTDRGSGRAQSSDQKTKSTLTVAVLVALLAVMVLLALVLLWRRRQKRRTGALTLNRGGKHNGVVDAWAGPARVSDEEAVITAAAGVSGGDKGAGVPEGEGAGSGSGRRPTLTTFFGRRKSRQGSLALEELKAEPGASLTGEEEPLVGSEDGAEEAPASGGPEAGGAEAP